MNKEILVIKYNSNIKIVLTEEIWWAMDLNNFI